METDDYLKIEELYNKYEKLLYTIAYKILNDKYLAEDAIQETFTKVINNLHKIEDINCPKARNFLVIICRNVSINMYNKKEKIYEHDISLEAVDNDYIEDNANVEKFLIDNESAKTIADAINDLQPIYRDVIVLKYIFECKNIEISEIFCISVDVVKKRLYRAKKLLTESLKRSELN